MKQLSNKIIFVFILAIGLSLVPTYKASARNDLVIIDMSRGIDDLDNVTDLGGGSSVSVSHTPNVSIPPNSVPLSMVNLTATLNKENYLYSPSESMTLTVDAINNQCSNSVSSIKISGYILSQGSNTSKSIIDNTLQGSNAITGHANYLAPVTPGSDSLIVQLKVYNAINPYLEDNSLVGSPEERNIHIGEKFWLDNEYFVFKGDYVENFMNKAQIQIDDFISLHTTHNLTYHPLEITDNLLVTTTITIPFTVVAPTPKSMKITVLKENGDEVKQGANRVTSQAVNKNDLLKIQYIPSNFNFPFKCKIPTQVKFTDTHPFPEGEIVENEVTPLFRTQSDVNEKAFFYVKPNSTTKYNVTCGID